MRALLLGMLALAGCVRELPPTTKTTLPEPLGDRDIARIVAEHMDDKKVIVVKEPAEPQPKPKPKDPAGCEKVEFGAYEGDALARAIEVINEQNRVIEQCQKIIKAP